MINVLYDIALWLLFVVIVPLHWWKSVKRGRPPALKERFGFIGAAADGLVGGDVIWVHAVSVGETIAARPLLRALRNRYPDKKIVLSNGTETGREVAAAIGEIDLRLYFPFDYRFAVRALLEKVRPQVVVIVETEIWPNFLRVAREFGIPVVLANGRISDRSFPRYLKLRPLFKPLLGAFAAFCMQSDEDCRRITAMGAPDDRVHPAGNLKYDIPSRVVPVEEKSALKEQFGIAGNLAVFTAGSTHRGEDEEVVAAFTSLVAGGKELVLVLVPRHPERSEEVADILRSRGLHYVRRSEMKEPTPRLAAGEVLLVDTVGELMTFYRLADVGFVGGSLVPTGGHNVLEPASAGVAVLFGPHMHNFREIAALLLGCGGAMQLEKGEELPLALETLFSDEAARVAMGERGAELVSRNSGATLRHLEVIERVLERRV